MILLIYGGPSGESTHLRENSGVVVMKSPLRLLTQRQEVRHHLFLDPFQMILELGKKFRLLFFDVVLDEFRENLHPRDPLIAGSRHQRFLQESVGDLMLFEGMKSQVLHLIHLLANGVHRLLLRDGVQLQQNGEVGKNSLFLLVVGLIVFKIRMSSFKSSWSLLMASMIEISAPGARIDIGGDFFLTVLREFIFSIIVFLL
jgi:hypothetical protein